MIEVENKSKWILCLMCLCVSTLVFGQSRLSLSEAYELARSNYPALKNIDIYKALETKENELIDQSRRPIVMLNGDASLQSEAIQIGEAGSPLSVEVPIYRAQAYGEISYSLYDGGVSNVRKQINEINTIIQTQQLEVNLYPLKSQVNQVFTGVQLGTELKEMYRLTEKDIETRRALLQASVENGVMLESELIKLDVRLLQLENDRIQVDADIRSAYALLSVILGRDIDQQTQLLIPDNLPSTLSSPRGRPELKLYEDKKMALEAQKKLVDVSDKPMISVFGQAGLAYPNNLNFADVSLSPFALGGVKASYKLFDKKDKTLKKQKLELQAELIEIQEETFRHNLEVQTARYQEEFQLLSDQVDKYQKIASLQAQILSQLKVQLDNGVITATDYLLQSTDELRARQNVEITQSKLKQKQLEYLTIYGTSIQ